MNRQLELFSDEYREPAHFVTYYRQALKKWPDSVMYYRHHRDSTGWSMATGGFFYARCCFSRGVITREQFRKYWKFNRRVRRWDSKKELAP
jgi:hypothetical protein